MKSLLKKGYCTTNGNASNDPPARETLRKLVRICCYAQRSSDNAAAFDRPGEGGPVRATRMGEAARQLGKFDRSVRQGLCDTQLIPACALVTGNYCGRGDLLGCQAQYVLGRGILLSRVCRVSDWSNYL